MTGAYGRGVRAKDDLSRRYDRENLLEGSYDCVDRVVLNGYLSICHSPGGFRTWWRTAVRYRLALVAHDGVFQNAPGLDLVTELRVGRRLGPSPSSAGPTARPAVANSW